MHNAWTLIRPSLLREFEPSDPATVDTEALIGNARAVFGSQEEDKASDLVRPKDPLQRLPRKDFGFVSFCKPEPLLPLSLNRARHDAIDSDIVNAQLMGKRAGQSNDSGLCRDIHRKTD